MEKIIQLGSLATTKFNHEERELIFMTRSILKTTENQSKALKKLIKIGFRLATVSKNGHVRIGHSLMGGAFIPLGSSPSDRRFALNFIRGLKRAILLRRVA